MVENPNNPFWYPQFLKLKNILGIQINPATEEKQDDQIVLLQEIADSLPLESSSANAPSSVSVTTATTVILAANADRKGLVLINTGNRDCFIGINTPALLAKGIRLASSGGSWTMDPNTFTTQAINGIVAAATTTILIQEFE